MQSETVWDRDQLGHGGHGLLGVAAGEAEGGDDPAADPRLVHPLADRAHRTRDAAARHIRWLDREVLAERAGPHLRLHEDRVHRGDSHDRLARTRQWIRDLRRDQNLRAAEFLHLCYAHAVHSPIR